MKLRITTLSLAVVLASTSVSAYPLGLDARAYLKGVCENELKRVEDGIEGGTPAEFWTTTATAQIDGLSDDELYSAEMRAFSGILALTSDALTGAVAATVRDLPQAPRARELGLAATDLVTCFNQQRSDLPTAASHGVTMLIDCGVEEFMRNLAMTAETSVVNLDVATALIDENINPDGFCSRIIR